MSKHSLDFVLPCVPSLVLHKGVASTPEAPPAPKGQSPADLGRPVTTDQETAAEDDSATPTLASRRRPTPDRETEAEEDSDAAADAGRRAAANAEPLLEELDRLVGRHREELASCVGAWLRAQRRLEVEPTTSLKSRPKAKTEGDAIGLTTGTSFERFLNSRPGQKAKTQAETITFTKAVAFTAAKSAPGALVRDIHGHDAKVRKKRKGKKVAAESIFETRRRELEEDMSSFQRFMRSKWCEWLSGVLVTVNALFIGYQTEYMAQRSADMVRNGRDPATTEPTGFTAVQVVFCLLFIIELALRWVCDGLVNFFVGQDMWWNLMDVFVVGFSVVDLGLNLIFAAGQQGETNSVMGSISVARVFRVVRVVRIAKVIRVMRFFRELRMMVFSILGCAKSLVWVMICLTMTFYVFGIVFTSAVLNGLDTHAKYSSEATAELRKYFGTLWDSIISLYMAMSGGNDWSVYFEALGQLDGQYRACFLLFITFAVFAVVNIVTGVFVESAMQSNRKDREIVVHEELENKRAYLTSMRAVFDEMDTDDTGRITLDEFERRLDDERVIAFFNALKLDVSDAHTLFRLLDIDQSNEVSIGEFLSGCYRLQGEARSLDTKIMQVQVRFLQDATAECMLLLRELHQQCIPA